MQQITFQITFQITLRIYTLRFWCNFPRSLVTLGILLSEKMFRKGTFFNFFENFTFFQKNDYGFKFIFKKVVQKLCTDFYIFKKLCSFNFF